MFRYKTFSVNFKTRILRSNIEIKQQTLSQLDSKMDSDFKTLLFFSPSQTEKHLEKLEYYYVTMLCDCLMCDVHLESPLVGQGWLVVRSVYKQSNSINTAFFREGGRALFFNVSICCILVVCCKGVRWNKTDINFVRTFTLILRPSSHEGVSCLTSGSQVPRIKWSVHMQVCLWANVAKL